MAILESIGGALSSAILKALFQQMISPEFIAFIKGDKALYKGIKKLNVALLSVNAVINDAEEKRLTDPSVRDWLSELEEAIFEAADLVDEIHTRVLESKTDQVLLVTISDLFRGTKDKIVKTIDTLEFMMRQRGNLGLKEGVQARTFQGSPPPPLNNKSSVRGRDGDISAVLEALQSLSNDVRSNTVSVISIVGMGGIGKSTLAQIVYEKARRNFHHSAWISLRGEFDVFKLTKAIFEAVTFQSCHIQDLYNLQVQLGVVLTGKKFFFVLDDVWNDNFMLWDSLKAPFESAACGSKIIVTTRDDGVASMMTSVMKHQLLKLSEQDSWLLFKEYAFDKASLVVDPDLEIIGRQIAIKCEGLPLAIKSLGGLCSELNAEEWEKILTSNIWDLSKDRDILPALWLSYYHLPSSLKRCFAYCSIFPKNYEMDKGKLVLLWMAEDLLQPQEGRRIEDVGKDCIRALVSRSLFQASTTNPTVVTMHDLVHDLALFISRGFGQMLENNDSIVVGRKIRHLSLMNEDIDACKVIEKFQQAMQATNNSLRTFLSIEKNEKGNGLPGGDSSVLPETITQKATEKFKQSVQAKKSRLRMFLSLEKIKTDDDSLKKNLTLPDITTRQRLRVFSLRGYPIVALPQTISNLKHLRYFDLFCAKVKKLPDEIVDLCNLQTLMLQNCSDLAQLPSLIGKLKRLRYLDLSSTGVEKLPDSVCDLHNLQTLLLENCKKLTRLPGNMEYLTCLRHLNIHNSSLVEMPPRMSKMKDLRMLTNFIVGEPTNFIVGEEPTPSTIKDLGELQHLQGYLEISGLQNINVEDGDVSRNHLEDKKYLSKLLLKWKCLNQYSLEDGIVLEKLLPHTNLRELSIEFYNGGGFPSWVGDVSFSNMVKVTLIGCRRCFKLPPLGKLTSLRELRIQGFYELEEIGAEFYKDNHDDEVINPFKSLEILYFEDMPNWQNWLLMGAEGRPDNAFPHLKQLHLEKCRRLINVVLPERILRLKR